MARRRSRSCGTGVGWKATVTVTEATTVGEEAVVGEAVAVEAVVGEVAVVWGGGAPRCQSRAAGCRSKPATSGILTS